MLRVSNKECALRNFRAIVENVMTKVLRLTLAPSGCSYRTEHNQPALCVGFVEERLLKAPRHIVLRASTKPKKGFEKVRVFQQSSLHDPHHIMVKFDGDIPQFIFSAMCNEVARMKRWASFRDRAGVIYFRISEA